MAKKNIRRKRGKQTPYLPVLAGLFFIGIAIVILAFGDAKDTPAGQETFSSLSVSYPAPELSLEHLDGRMESLADYRGEVILVNNWATWCPPCKAEMPVLEAYYEDHADQGFTIIAVEAGDPKDTVAQFVDAYGLQFEIWLDPRGASVRAFGNGSLPNSYVIDRSGTVRYAWTGEVNRQMLEKYVTPLLIEQ